MLFNSIVATASLLAIATAIPIIPTPSTSMESREAKECPLSGVSPPIAVSTPLPPPTSMRLVHVAIGRGTQNYTCGTNATAAPTPRGAKATLYGASCMAVEAPQQLQTAPATAYTSDRSQAPFGLQVSGEHYFHGPTQPIFDMTASGFGITQLAKNASAPAPVETPTNVPWLYLTPVSSTDDISAVYRLNTKAGAAPKTCDGKLGDFQVDYAAEYWFYKPIDDKLADEQESGCLT